MKITSLLENTTLREDMHTEHGLSLYIETHSHRILFDMGQTDLFYENAKKLNIDLSDVDTYEEAKKKDSTLTKRGGLLLKRDEEIGSISKGGRK